MANIPGCLVHFEGEEGPLKPFTHISFSTFLTCHESWLSLDGDQREIAQRTKNVVQHIKDDDVGNFFYHRNCYSKFTNKTLIHRSQVRCEKMKHDSNKDTNTSNCQDQPKKLLRSATTSFTSQNKAILPPVCIICLQEKTYFTEPVSKSKFSKTHFEKRNIV